MLWLLLFACGSVDWESLLSNDTVIDASCVGEDTVLIDGTDLCEEYERTGRLECSVGYRIILDGNVVCP